MNNKIKVGQKFRVKEWEDMRRQYGLTRAGAINVPAAFLPEMKYLCGQIVTVSQIGEGEVFSVKECVWTLSIPMVEPVIKHGIRSTL